MGRVYDGREALVSGGVQAAASSALVAARVEPRRWWHSGRMAEWHVVARAGSILSQPRCW